MVVSDRSNREIEEVSRALLARERALQRFARWERSHPATPTPQAVLSGVGFLYELLPAGSRYRAVDTSGVRELHRSLRVLSTAVR
jgi:hypothetical protein